MNEVVLAGYEVGPVIGQGGMATVYRAHDLRHDRPVAIKVIHPSTTERFGAERFLREIRITARLQHPNILPVFDSGDLDGRFWYAMPFIDGASLRERMEREGRMSVEESLRITRDVANALEHAHRAGVIHRDIKPENILLSGSHALVADFGIARMPADTSPGLTREGSVVGTPAYMSPEQAIGESGIDGRSDIYALACVLFEMLSGSVPHGDRGIDRLLMRRITEPPPPLSALCPVPGGVEEALLRALATTAEDRFATPTEFLAALDRPEDTVVSGPRPRVVRSVAVLPFATISANEEAELFSEGLTDEIITSLSGLRSLRVTSRASVLRLKGDTRPAPAIARELGVRHLLSGTVRRAGSKLRVSVQLIDAAVDAQLWAERFDGTLDDVFEIQERIATATADALAIRLTGSEARHVRNRPLDDIRAWECYMRGRHEAWSMSPGSLDRAEQLARSGLAMVGPNVQLFTLQGLVAILRTETGQGGLEQLEIVESVAKQIFDLEPESPRGHGLLGSVEWKRGRVQQAVRHLKRAMAGDPGNLDTAVMLANIYLTVGHTERAQPLLDRLLELDPLSPLSHCMPGWRAVLDGRLDEALPPFERMMKLATVNPMGQMFYGWSLASVGRKDDAIAQLRQVKHAVFGPFSVFFAHALAGDSAAARVAWNDDLAKSAWFAEFLARQAGEAFALIGDKPAAIGWLRRSSELGFLHWRFLAERDVHLASLRGTKAFEEYIAELKGWHEAFEP